MKGYVMSVVMLTAVSLGWGSAVTAQVGEPKAVPVEFFACNWVEGKGMDDLQKVVADFQKYADANDSNYSAWLLSPQFHQPGIFDVGWLGSWPSGTDFGVSQENWQSKGRDMAAAFAEVVECGEHIMALSKPINAPEGTPEDGILLVAACSLKDGKTLQDAYAAHLKSGLVMKGQGSLGVSWFYMPALGTGHMDFDYWHLVGFYRYSDMGATMEMYVNEGGMKKAQELIGSTSTCDAWTVFDAQSVRVGGS
ncbi:MAG: hypothetical protein P8Y92_15930 [Halioglobus sp.]|jgi:hypothetical protein